MPLSSVALLGVARYEAPFESLRAVIIMLPLSLLEFACFEAAFSECLQFSEQSGRNCIEVAYRSVCG